MTMKDCSVNDATHVKVNGQYERIVSKQGVHDGGRVDRSFSVTTESGRNVSMWEAQRYGKE